MSKKIIALLLAVAATLAFNAVPAFAGDDYKTDTSELYSFSEGWFLGSGLGFNVAADGFLSGQPVLSWASPRWNCKSENGSSLKSGRVSPCRDFGVLPCPEPPDTQP